MAKNNFELHPVSEADLGQIRRFYQSYIGKPGSTWNEHYPNEEILQADYSTGNLYGLYENGELLGAISVSNENHLDDLPCWIYREHTKEIARVVIAPKHQGKGYGTIMLTCLFELLRQKGTTVIHLLVSLNNPRAINLYQRFNFENRGQFFLYEHDYYAMEAKI